MPTYLDFALPIKDASRGLALASSFLVLAVSAPPGLAAFTEFFMRWAVARPRFLYRSVFFIVIYRQIVYTNTMSPLLIFYKIARSKSQE